MAVTNSPFGNSSSAEPYEVGRWREYAAHYRAFAPELNFALEPNALALLVVDVQRKTCDRSVQRGMAHSLPQLLPDIADRYFGRLERVVLPNLVRLLALFRQHSLRVAYFRVGPRLPTGDDLPFSFRVSYRAAHATGDENTIYWASPEFEIVNAVKPRADELVFNKVTRGGFTGTGAELVLRNLGVRQLLIAGGATHVCVESTARTATDIGFAVALVEDACISQFPLLHDATMINFAMSMGRIMSTDQVIQELEAPE